MSDTHDPVRLLRLEHGSAPAEQVACWYADEWGGDVMSDVIVHPRAGPGLDELPLTWVADSNGIIIGAAQLKRREVPALYDFEHWLGGVYVDPPSRGRGVARQLIERCVVEAVFRGIDYLYLQTEEHNVGLYAGLGWLPAQLPPDFVHERPVMVRSIGTTFR